MPSSLKSLCLSLSLCFLVRIADAQSFSYPLRTKNGLVSSQNHIASKVGAAALRRGGNAVDAAVATAFTLAVTHPAAGNIGGGGFLVLLLPGGESTTFDFRERAPASAHLDMFKDENGKYSPTIHHHSHRAVGVPGSVAGLYLAHQKHGKLPWKSLVKPAVRIARNGFRVSAGLAGEL
ncbi:MAG: gamma-glutamyltransferase, partial [Planctomycetota bacterium]